MTPAAVVVAVVVAIMGQATAASILMPHFSWSDCGTNGTEQVHILKLDLSSPMTIPGQIQVKELQATIKGALPQDAVIQFSVQGNSSFGPDYPWPVPCFPSQGGSCVYGLCDMLNMTSDLSLVTRQLVMSLEEHGMLVTTTTTNGVSDKCSVSSPNGVDLQNVTFVIPSMLHTVMDTFINTNNYYVTTRILASDGTQLGCLQINMPVHKPCNDRWLCPKSIDEVIAIMNPKP